MNRKKIIAIIPALNEEKTIKEVLSNVKKYVDEIIVVDDNSTDNTAAIAQEYATVLRNKKNLGYSKSVNKAFRFAEKRGFDIIVTLDADGQHLAEDIPKLVLPILKKEADIVVGKRPFKARFMEYVFAKYGRKKGVSDPLCGMKAYSYKVYKKVGFFDTINSVGTQLVFVALKRKFKIKEINIKLKKRKDIPRFGRTIKANIKLFLAYIRLIKYLKR